MEITAERVRKLCIELRRRTTFYEQTNETYYPARWSYGEGVGDASTSCKYDCRTSLARERTIAVLIRKLRDESDALADGNPNIEEQERQVREYAEAWRRDE